MSSQVSKIYILIIFLLFALTGILLSAGAIWADVEADFYGFTKLTNERLQTLSCPAYITINETSEVSVRLKNSTNREVNQLVRVQLSMPVRLFSQDDQRLLAPGETGVFSWPVNRQNVDLQQFIFASVYRFSTYPVPAQQSTCGIYVLNIPFLTGWQFTWLVIVISLSGMWISRVWWVRTHAPLHGQAQEIARWMLAMLVFVPITLFLGLWVNWFFGGMFLVVCVLMCAVAVRFFIRA